MDQAKVSSTVATLLLAAALAYLILTRSLFGTEPVSIALQACAFLLMVWARLTMGARSFHFTANLPKISTLATTGPYRWVRHPIYAALCLFAWTGIAVHFTLINAVIGVVIGALVLWRIHLEEQALRARFQEYNSYSQRTKKLIPFVY